MTELETLYRKAPRQASPDRLDAMVLGRAAQRVAGKKQPLWGMTPLKTLAVSFSVAGLGVALLLRHGVPPLEQSPAAIDRAVQGALEKSEESRLEAELLPEIEKEAADVAVDASRLASATPPESDVAELPESVVIVAEDFRPIPESSAQSIEPALIPSETVLTDAISVDLGDQFADSSVQESSADQPPVLSTQLADETALIMERDSPIESLSTQVDSLIFAEDAAADGELLVAQSPMAANTRQSKKLSRMAAPAPRADASSSIVKQSAPSSSNLPQRIKVAEQIIAPPDSAKWVLNQPVQSFTLQLATASSMSYLQEYAESLRMSSPFYIVSLATETNKPNYGLLYGLFDDVQQALDTVETLDSEARRFQPWVRRIGKLQKEVLLP